MERAWRAGGPAKRLMGDGEKSHGDADTHCQRRRARVRRKGGKKEEEGKGKAGRRKEGGEGQATIRSEPHIVQ